MFAAARPPHQWRQPFPLGRWLNTRCRFFGHVHQCVKCSLVLAVVILASVANSSAQTPPDLSQCAPLGNVAALNSSDEETAREATLEFIETSLCRYGAIRAHTERALSTDDTEFFDALLDQNIDFRELVKSRSRYPGRQLLERLKSPRFSGQIETSRDIIFYMSLTTDIFTEDNCPVEKINGFCGHGTIFQMLSAQGRDPRSEFERIGREARLQNVDPWFLIGDVVVDNSILSDKSAQLRRAARDARTAYVLATETVELRLAQLADASRTRQVNVARIRERLQKLLDEIRQIRIDNAPSLEEVQATSTYQNQAGRIERLTARTTRIDIALEYLNQRNSSGDAFNQNRIAELQSERQSIDSELEQLVQAQQDLMLPRLSPSTQRRLDKLEGEAELEAKDVERRIAREDREVESAQRLYDEARQAEQLAERAYVETDAAMREFLANTRYAISAVETADADIRLLGSHEVPEIPHMNTEIAELLALTNEAWRLREMTRRQMMQAASDVDGAAASLLQAGYLSLAAQFATEVVEMGWSLRKAASGGPVMLLMESTRQIVSNLIFPPTYYEAAGGELDYGKTTDIIRGHNSNGYPAWYYAFGDTFSAGNMSAEAALEFAKTVGGHPTKVWAAAIAADASKQTIDTARREAQSRINREVAETAFSNISLAMRDVSGEAEKLAGLRKDLDALTGNAGKVEFGKAVIGDLLKGLGGSLAKQFTKKQIADAVEQPYFDLYMASQVDLSNAVRLFIAAGNEYYELSEWLKFKRAVRDAVIELFRPDTNQFEDNNEPFFADPGYRIWIDQADQASNALNADVTLGGIELVRDATSTRPTWRLPEDSLQLFKSSMPERLELRIMLKE